MHDESSVESPNAFLLGKLIVDHAIATRKQVDECLKAQGDGGVSRPLGTLLRDRGYITEDQLGLILKIQRQLQKGAGAPEVPPDRLDEAEEDSILKLLILLKQAAQKGDVHESLRLYARMEEKVSNYLRIARLHVQKTYLAAYDTAEIQDYLNRKVLSCKVCGEPFSVSQNGVRSATFRCANCGVTLTFQQQARPAAPAAPGPAVPGAPSPPRPRG